MFVLLPCSFKSCKEPAFKTEAFPDVPHAACSVKDFAYVAEFCYFLWGEEAKDY